MFDIIEVPSYFGPDRGDKIICVYYLKPQKKYGLISSNIIEAPSSTPENPILQWSFTCLVEEENGNGDKYKITAHDLTANNSTYFGTYENTSGTYTSTSSVGTFTITSSN